MDTNFGDKEMLNDMLAGQKMITGLYNTMSNECSDESLRNDMLTILREEHNMQNNVFKEMQKRGWYTPVEADQSAVMQSKAKFSGIQSTL